MDEIIKPSHKLIKNLVRLALIEDIGEDGDITTRNLIPPTQKTTAKIISGDFGIVCGLSIAKEVFKTIDRKCTWRSKFSDGDFVKKGQTIAVVNGFARAILTGERTAMNFLSHMSGISTFTGRFVKKAGNTSVKIYDTRKTLPGLRILEKYAVRCGGGYNNRGALDEMVIVKDNHLQACINMGLPVGQVVKSLYTKITRGTMVEFEAKNMREVMLALQSGVDIIMLDNMSLKNMKKAIKLIRQNNKNIKIELSGGINLKNIEKISKLKADRISIGSITHSAPSFDFSLELC